MWDLAEDANSIRLIESFIAAGKTIALVCHAPGVLHHVKNPDGSPFVQGRSVTGFTNTEEAAVRPRQGRAVPGRGRVGQPRRGVRVFIGALRNRKPDIQLAWPRESRATTT